jgi:centromere protein I
MVRVTPLYYEKLLHMYTALLQHWACRICNANSADPRSSVANSGPNALKDLVAHVNKLSTSLILSIPTTSQSPLISSIISFYEALSSSSRPSVVLIVLPPPHLAYLLAQSSSTAVFSRICGVYACYKIAFDRHPTPISSYYPTTMTIPFNSCLRDLFNMIWASRALDTKQSDGFFCDPSLRQVLNTYLRDIDRDYDISVALNLSYNPLLSSLSAVAWKHLENDEIERQGYTMGEVRLHTGPVSQRSSEALRVNQGVNVGFEKYKISVLEWLTERGLGGVKELMYSTNQRLKGIKG